MHWDDQNEAIVPLSERRKILSFCHDHQTSKYLGVRKSLLKYAKRIIGKDSSKMQGTILQDVRNVR